LILDLETTRSRLPRSESEIQNPKSKIGARRSRLVAEIAPTTEAYLMLSATLFAVGLIGVIVRRNMITVLMAIELMMNAVNINLVAFSQRLSSLEGQVFTIFIITVAAGEAAVGLAIIIQLYRLRSSVNVDDARELNG
jgi:NADH-quinone oxidoreductase subunit K